MEHQQEMMQLFCHVLVIVVCIHQMSQKLLSAEILFSTHQTTMGHVVDHPFIIQVVFGTVGKKHQGTIRRF